MKQTLHDMKRIISSLIKTANVDTGTAIAAERFRKFAEQMNEGKAQVHKLYTKFMKLFDEEEMKWLATVFHEINDTKGVPRLLVKPHICFYTEKTST